MPMMVHTSVGDPISIISSFWRVTLIESLIVYSFRFIQLIV